MVPRGWWEYLHRVMGTRFPGTMTPPVRVLVTRQVATPAIAKTTRFVRLLPRLFGSTNQTRISIPPIDFGSALTARIRVAVLTLRCVTLHRVEESGAPTQPQLVRVPIAQQVVYSLFRPVVSEVRRFKLSMSRESRLAQTASL
jgi:hypothetical protein